MAEKGSKYARKHQQIVEIDDDDYQTESLEDDSFLGVIYDDVTFLKTFQKLPLTEQIKAYRTLKRLAEPKSNKKTSPSDRLLAQTSKYKLEQINLAAGLRLEEKQHYALSADELHIIRMDCYGSVDERPRHQLSTYYREFLKNKLPKQSPFKAYDLDKAPAWQLFRQFRNFRKIERSVKQYLVKSRLNPEALKVMGVRDFSDVIFKAFADKSKNGKSFFLKGDAPRNAFVKKVSKKFESKIAQLLRQEHLDERYIRSLLSAMQTFGTTDAEKIIITEIYFTPRILKDMAKARMDHRQYHVGDEIPPALIKSLMKADKGSVLAARDEAGNLLSSSNFPSFEVHHKTAVLESGSLAFIAMVNYENNYVLVPADVHRHVLHGFDRLTSAAHKEAYHRRLEFIDKNATFMSGLSEDKQIYFDWTKRPSYKEHLKEDSQYIVSYDEVMGKLALNRQEYMEGSKSVEFDVDSVVQVIRHKRGITSDELLKKRKINRLEKNNKQAIAKISEDKINQTLSKYIKSQKSRKK